MNAIFAVLKLSICMQNKRNHERTQYKLHYSLFRYLHSYFTGVLIAYFLILVWYIVVLITTIDGVNLAIM